MIYSHDVIVYLSIFEGLNKNSTYQKLSQDIGIKPSQIHASVMNGIENRLLIPPSDKGALSELVCQPILLVEFLVYAIPFIFPLRPGPVKFGIPTGSDSPPLAQHFPKRDLPWIWPDPKGTVKGTEIVPIHKSIPSVAKNNKNLAYWFYLIEMIRGGNAREKSYSMDWIKHRILVERA